MKRQRVINHFSHQILLVLALLGIFISPSEAQVARQKLNISISWEDDRPFLETNFNDRDIESAILQPDSEDPILFLRIPISSNFTFNYSISNLEWQNGLEPAVNDLRERIVTEEGIERKKKFGLLFIPLVSKDESISYSINRMQISILTRRVQISPSRPVARASNSVLATGDWYKFGIGSTGVYKITYEFLQSLDIDVNSIPHTNYGFYGHRGGMLPKLAGAERTDDLIEIPVKVVASGSTLQPGDYILFYGEGPESWNYDELKDRFVHEHHIYSDFKGYFITTSLSGGLRIPSINPAQGIPDISFDDFHDHNYIEEDIYNLNKSGSDWLGEEFSVDLQKTWTFNFPGLITSEDVILDYRVAARSAGVSTSFDFIHNSNIIGSSSIGQVGTSYTSNAGRAAASQAVFNAVGDDISITVKYNQSNFSAKGWLDYLALNVRRGLQFEGSDLHFRHKEARDYNLVEYRVAGMNSGVEIWDVSDQFDIKAVNYNLNGSTAIFNAEGGSIGQYVAFGTATRAAQAFGKIENQDLHGLSDADLIIITRSAMLSHAVELAQFHQDQEGYVSHVVDIDHIFNEFSSGNTDVAAIRDFLKMFYDRNDNYPDYVCLFGDGTFNNRDLGTYFIPTYEGEKTLETLETLVTDDFYVFLDSLEGDNVNSTSNMLDMAIGRIPADNLVKAGIAVEKIKTYYSNASFGNWRNVGTFIADDQDNNIHIDDGQIIADTFISHNPVMNIEKIYLDAFRQITVAGGGLYPDVNLAINNRMFKGTLFLNYIGHGGGNGLADERVITLEDIESWNNPEKLTLIISATCEFTRYDDFERYSAGERAFFKRDGGAIALVTTVRLVFSNKNFEMNQSFMAAFEKGFDDPGLTLGDIILDAKNNTPTGTGNRKFTLIGDPALRIAFPEYEVQTTAIDSMPYIPGNDTLKALTLVNIEGEVRYNNGTLIDDFNGLVYPTVYDKVKTLVTLGNDRSSNIIPFDVQNSIIYAGKIQVSGGKFNYSFVVPKDINYSIGDGKISYYAHDDTRDAAGIDTVLVGGGGDLDSNNIDNDDPIVEVFIDDEAWISGDFTDEYPDLLVRLYDDNGINTVGSGIGHDIVAIVDDDNQNAIILNDFYESELNSYQEGKVFFPMEQVATGTHGVKVKAWDVFNNSGEGFTEFVVAEDAGLALSHVLNYPNPFTTSTLFMFEHNRKGDVLDVRIEVFTVSGRVVKTLQQTETLGERRVEIPWDGLDEYGDKLGKGVYIYRVTLKDSSGEKVDEYQKLVLLR